ncbi:MAG: ABC transporter permease, partial [Candidatus Deferrimicrobium sp.]|nr:ABC transporter permease [Candidatus Deferrimicrobium sp.]
MGLKSFDQHKESLRDGREVYFDGERVADVTAHPVLGVGMAFAGIVTAYTARLKDEQGLSSLFRFGITPLFLFSGTFFPVTQLPGWLQPVAYATPLWHGVSLCRG